MKNARRSYQALLAAAISLFYVSVALAQEAEAVAEEVAESAAPAAEESGMLGSWFGDGGPVMWVLLIVSIIGTLIFFERFFDLYVLRRLNADGFCGEVLSLVNKRQYSAALEACNVNTMHPLATVLRAGLVRANRREKDIERAMENEMLDALPGLQKRVSFIALLANTATLIGLLGTIFGLITAFNSVAAASAAERQEALAAGISQAMYTTAFGISVAVPLLFFHHFISKRMEGILMEIEGGASGLLVALAGEAASAAPPSPLSAASPPPAPR